MSETAGKAAKSTGDRAPEARSRPTGGFLHQRHPAAAALGGGAPRGEAAAAGSHAGEGSDKAQPATQPPNAWHRRAEELGEEEDADVAHMYQQQANMAEALFNDLSLEDKAGQGAQEKTHGHVQKQELPARISPTGVVSADAGAAPAGAQAQQPQPQPQPQPQQPQHQPQHQPQQQMHHFQQMPQFQQPQPQQQQALGADGFGYGYQQYYDASGMPFIPQYQGYQAPMQMPAQYYYSPVPMAYGSSYPPPPGAGMEHRPRPDVRYRHEAGYHRGRYRGQHDPYHGFDSVPWGQLVGRVSDMAWDQHGCRLLQKKIDELGPEAVSGILSELQGNLPDLMTDQFGNYLAQRLIDASSALQLDGLISEAGPRLPAIACNPHGTRAVQKLIDCLNREGDAPGQVKRVSDALADSVVDLIKDANGNHVITRCLHKQTPDQNDFIYEAVTKNVVTVSKHRHGCCVLQRCIDFASPEQAGALATEISSNALPLVQDAFGNYVVQYVLDMGLDGISYRVMNTLRGSYPMLSLQKFSSNVIEKCVQMAPPDMLGHILTEIEQAGQLEALLRDQYGNYVVQRLLTCCSSSQVQRLVPRMKVVLLELRNTPHGKKIIAKLLRNPAFSALVGFEQAKQPPKSK